MPSSALCFPRRRLNKQVNHNNASGMPCGTVVEDESRQCAQAQSGASFPPCVERQGSDETRNADYGDENQVKPTQIYTCYISTINAFLLGNDCA